MPVIGLGGPDVFIENPPNMGGGYGRLPHEEGKELSMAVLQAMVDLERFM